MLFRPMRASGQLSLGSRVRAAAAKSKFHQFEVPQGAIRAAGGS